MVLDDIALNDIVLDSIALDDLASITYFLTAYPRRRHFKTAEARR